MRWTVVIAATAEKSLKRVPANDRVRIETALKAMSVSPFDGDVKRLKNDPRGAYRRRVGDWRILFELFPEHGLVAVQAIERRTSTTY